ncbi:MAG: GNAT family N-acetyltransferase [Nitriliruptoraceae bacterium]|nr:GNAT family N-acetyltransferase [Nitriliruptoraceae bacterium]
MSPSARPRPEVRAARPADLPRIAALTLASYDTYGSIQGTYREALADPGRRIAGSSGLWVAELDGQVVGTVTYVRPGDAEWEGRAVPEGDAGFRVLAVDPTSEGRGVGRALVGACLARARADGAHRIVIVSMAWMHRAHGLYEGLGFARRPDLDVRFPGGEGYVFTADLTADAATRFPPPGPVPDRPPWFEEVWDPERDPDADRTNTG